MIVNVIIPAAGSGSRFMGEGKLSGPKTELDLAGRPVFLRSCELFVGRTDVSRIILAVHPDNMQSFKFKFGDRIGFHGIKLVEGGRQERWETVKNALAALSEDCTHVAIHDAVRPLASSRLIDRLFFAAEQHHAIVPGVPVADTLKRIDDRPEARPDSSDPLDAILGGAGKPQFDARPIVDTIDRRELVGVQTPQVFERQLLLDAYAAIDDGKIDTTTITDDAGLLEALGKPVYVVEGESTNLKITRAADFDLADAYARVLDKRKTKDLARKRLFGPE